MNVGYVGLGAMGHILASHLISQYSLSVWDLNQGVLADFSSRGVDVPANVADMGKYCDVVILCLPKSEHVAQALFGETGLAQTLRPGAIVVDQTSGDPAQTAAFAERLAQQGVTLLDAPVAGGIPAAHAKEISIMLSGDPTAIETVKPVMSTISPHLFVCGDKVGSAQTLKSINNTINSVNRFGALEIAALGRVMGLPLAQVIEALDNGLSKSFLTSRLLGGIANQTPSTDFALAGMFKDVGLSRGMARTHRLARPMSEVGSHLLATAMAVVGEDARLEDLIAFTERLVGCQYRAVSEVSLSDAQVAQTQAVLTLALQAVHALAVLENIHLLQALQVNLASAGLVLSNGSAESRMLQALFSAVAGECEPLPALSDWLEALEVLANVANAQHSAAAVTSQALSCLYQMLQNHPQRQVIAEHV